MKAEENTINEVLALLEQHYQSFTQATPIATRTKHPVPVDSRGWSQIIVSVLTGLYGLSRQKGADLEDGSDVKAANTWEAIDKPRFNGVIKAGTKAAHAGKITSLDAMPFLFFVMWDKAAHVHPRCRIWSVRPQVDTLFRDMCEKWYKKAAKKKSESHNYQANFQLHPPRGKDENVITNSEGNLSYPLLFCAIRKENQYRVVTYDPGVMKHGLCRRG
jgi:hypothetical protein